MEASAKGTGDCESTVPRRISEDGSGTARGASEGGGARGSCIVYVPAAGCSDVTSGYIQEADYMESVGRPEVKLSNGPRVGVEGP